MTYGQNSNALGSVAAVIAAIAATAAATYAVRTYEATIDQLEIARGQAKLAKAQMEAALRPFLRIKQQQRPDDHNFELENIGSGSAHRISWDYTPYGEPPWDFLVEPDQDLEEVLSTNVLPPNAQESFNPESTRFRATGILIKYFSSDDRIFITRIGRRPDGTMIQYHFNISNRLD